MIDLPKVDTRTASDVAHEVLTQLRLNRLREEQLKGRLDVALVNIFSRFSEIVIERLNRAPEKKFLAFLDLLGVSPLPMEAAAVPLTFYRAPKAARLAVVPAGTQVAAPPPPANGNQKPVVFETQSELAVTAAQLDSLFVKNGRDAYADLSSALLPAPSSQQQGAISVPDRACVAVFQAIPHLFYVSIPCNPAWQTIDRLTLQFVMDTASSLPGEPITIQWEAVSKGSGPDAKPVPQILSPSSDTTEGLSRSGKVELLSVPGIAVSAVDGRSSCWLGCRLLTPLMGQGPTEDAPPRPSQVPVIAEVLAECEHGRTGLPIEQAFYEKQALDVTKPLFPFGPRPALGDAFYLGCREAFSEQGATITLHFEIVNTAGSDSAIPLVNPNNVQLSWEFWDGQAWSALNSPVRSLRLGSESAEAGTDARGSTNFSDETDSLSKDGSVSFNLPGAPAELALNGMKNYWVRAHIAAGDYGRETRVVRDAAGTLSTVPSTLAPPCIQSVKVDYSVKKSSKPAIVAVNEWRASDVAPGVSFKAFLAPSADAAVPALYLGFSTPVAQQSASTVATSTSAGAVEPFPQPPVSAYLVLDERSPHATVSDPAQIGTVWEYWSRSGWKTFTVADGTQSLRKSGLLQFLIPEDFASSAEFGRRRHWLRMRLPQGKLPPLRSIILNTTLAVQGVTIRNEILGASNGEPHQRFRTSSPSVLPGQRLEVCEPTMPSSAEQEILRSEFGGQEFIHPAAENNQSKGYWITWREVSTFNASAARDRHYILDHVTGEVLFGDGVCGMIPPILAGNIRIRRYRTGGGAIGNQPAQAVKQLVSAVPYVQKVVNWIPASGGSDPEPEATIIERGPREIRHGGRAVTFEDYEDLALRSSREVARVRCVAQSDLASDPVAKLRRPGLVSVVVVPRSVDTKPVPSVGLLQHVKDFLDARRLATAELVVVGPEYVRVDVEAEIVVERPQEASEVEQRVDAALTTYLHPVWGGPSRSGWDFGRLPQRSDIYVLIERIRGVSHIRDLALATVPERPGIEKTKHFLVYCGRHTLKMTL